MEQYEMWIMVGSIMGVIYLKMAGFIMISAIMFLAAMWEDNEMTIKTPLGKKIAWFLLWLPVFYAFWFGSHGLLSYGATSL